MNMMSDKRVVLVVGNGVNCELFKPIRYNHRSYFLYVGRLAYRKGLFDLIEAFSSFCKTDMNVSLRIAGKGPLKQKLVALINEKNLASRIIFEDYVSKDRLIWLYQNAIATIIPSHYEGLPTVLLESMSCGTPAIATDVGGNSEVVVSGKNGFLIPPKEPQKIVEAMQTLLASGQDLEEYCKNSRDTILKQYSWSTISSKILKIFREAVR